MKFIDLFSGIGGFRSALEKNGHECIGFAEIDKYAIQSYKAIYDTENEIEFGDISKIENLHELSNDVDIVVGGSPCQSFSVAGKQGGFEDTRGTLFFEYAKTVKDTQPDYFLYENVKGMVSHDKGKTIRTVLEAFNELGYYVDFNIFNSKFYDIPQNRERIYILGKRKDLVESPKYQEISKGKSKFDELHNWAVENINYTKMLPTPKTEITKKLADILEDNVDEKYYLSDEKTANLTLNEDLSGALNYYNYRDVDSVHSADKVSPTLNTMQGGNRQPKIAVREATKKGYALAEEGDSVNVSFPKSKTRRGRVGKQVAQTIQAGEVNQGVVMSDIRIRKFTPLECWRLQGFTDEQFYKAKNDGVSNSQLYKQAGNSVTVNVVDAIVQSITQEDN